LQKAFVVAVDNFTFVFVVQVIENDPKAIARCSSHSIRDLDPSRGGEKMPLTAEKRVRNPLSPVFCTPIAGEQL